MDEKTLENKLALIKDVKRFCVEELGLAPNEAYTTIVNSKQIFYAVYSCSKYELKPIEEDREFDVFKSGFWCKAYSFMEKTMGLDTYIEKTLSATERKEKEIGSTTPITKQMLMSPEIIMIQTIFHENAHMHLRHHKSDYIARHIEEPIADYFAYQASHLYYRNDKKMKEDINIIKEKDDKFKNWCRKNIEELSETYNIREKNAESYRISKEKGRKICLEARKEYETFTGRKDNVNSAFFLSWMPYVKCAREVEEILKDKNPRDYIKILAQSQSTIYNPEQLKSIIIPSRHTSSCPS
jgi:hypothetical protein